MMLHIISACHYCDKLCTVMNCNQQNRCLVYWKFLHCRSVCPEEVFCMMTPFSDWVCISMFSRGDIRTPTCREPEDWLLSDALMLELVWQLCDSFSRTVAGRLRMRVFSDVCNYKHSSLMIFSLAMRVFSI